jgi:hypothetical protein
MYNDDDDYKVGYKCPPRQYQYQPGKSGNPKGRPKKLQLGVPELVEKFLDVHIFIKEDGKKKRVTAREAIVRRVQHDATAGKPQALELLLLLYQKAGHLPDIQMPYPCFVDTGTWKQRNKEERD